MPLSSRSTKHSIEQHTVLPGTPLDKYPSCSSPPYAEKVNPDRSLITISSGRCRRSIPSGKQTLSCDCPKGFFSVPLEVNTTGDFLCIECDHELKFHDSIENTPDTVRSEPPIFSPLDCPRSETVSQIWVQLQAVQVLYVRGTPTTGKSTLANLLHDYILKTRPEYTVYQFSWPTSLPPGINMISPYNQALNTILGKPPGSNDWPSLINTLIIIDEAQLSYNYFSLWNDFIKPLSSDPKWGPQIILFTSYGSPSPYPIDTPIGTLPVYFTANQRVSIRCLPCMNTSNISLYFSRTEFEHVVNRISLNYGQNGKPFLLTADLRSYIWDITNGHPGGVRAILDFLAHSNELRSFRNTGQAITLNIGVQVLDNNVLFIYYLSEVAEGIKRSLPSRLALQNYPALLQVLRSVLVDGCSRADPSNDFANECYRRGWLHAECYSTVNPKGYKGLY